MNSSEVEIRQIVESRANAVRKGTGETMRAGVADFVTIFDLVVFLRRLGNAAKGDKP